MTKHVLMVEGEREWAGKLVNGQSTYAVAGTFNQTGESDAEASTFHSYDAAEEASEFILNACRENDPSAHTPNLVIRST
jgi:hypothetical protein